MNDEFDRRREGEGGEAPSHLTPEQLTAYLDDDLAPGERARADLHLRTCAECRRALHETRAAVLLLRGLPAYRARRSFQLSPEQAGQGRTWWERWGIRLLPALPALRAATVAVAVLLAVVSAGEVIRDNSGRQAVVPQVQNAQYAQVTPTAPAAVSQPTTLPEPPAQETTESAPRESGQSDTLRQAEPTAAPPPSDSDTFGGEAVDGGGAGDTEVGALQPAPTGEAGGAGGAIAEEGEDTTASEEDTADGEGETAGSGLADQAPAGSGQEGAAAPAAAAAATESEESDSDDDASIMMSVPEGESTPPAEEGRNAAADKAADETNAAVATPATPTATEIPPTPTAVPATPSPLPAASPTATSTAVPTPVAQRQPGASGDDDVSGWRVAQIGLAVLLAWLVVGVVGLQRLRRRR